MKLGFITAIAGLCGMMSVSEVSAQIWTKVETSPGKYEVIYEAAKEAPVSCGMRKSQTGKTVKLRMEADGQPINNFIIVGKDTMIQKPGSPSPFMEFNIPAGEYTVGAMFIRDMPTMRWVLRENVVIDADTVMTFNGDEANRLVAFRPAGENGTEIKVPVYRYNPGMEFDYSGANVGRQHVSNIICHKKGLTMAVFTGIPLGRHQNKEEDDATDYDFMINEASDDIVMAEYRTVDWLDGSVSLIQMETCGIPSEPVGNITDNFQEVDFDIKKSDFYIPDSKREISNVIFGYVFGVDNRHGVSALNGFVDGGVAKAAILPREKTFTTVTVSKLDCEVAQSGSSGMTVSGIVTPQAYLDGNGWHYADMGTGCFMSSSFGYTPYKGYVEAWPGHPAFSFAETERHVVFGNSAPVNAVLVREVAVDGKDAIQILPHFIGMAGESRNVDNYAMKVSVECEGKVIKSASGSSVVIDRNPKGSSARKMSVNVTNRNFTVDGIKGLNLTRFDLNENNDDIYPPSLRRLTFKDNSGRIANVFENASDGKILFSAGDFDIFPRQPDGAAVCRPEGLASVKLEYSPYGSEEWKELEVSPVADMKNIEAFGDLYEGTLADVDGKSGNGWYDVRISLEDTAGNRMEQTLSPAFRIVGHDGVETVSTGESIYGGNGRIIAPEGAEVYDISGVRVGVDELTPGVYMVRCNNQTVKVIVK